MISRPAIIDTNVVVAGLITTQAQSPVARILDAMLVGAFTFVLSEALLAEYRTVLIRPRLRKLHGLSVADIDTLLTDLVRPAVVLAPQAGAAAPDLGDQLLWDLLACRTNLILVSGDKLLQDSQDMAGRVLSPQVFCDELATTLMRRKSHST